MTSKLLDPPSLYNDLNKKANDLLTKDFPITHKIEFKTLKKPGPGFESSLSDKDGVSVGVLTPKFQWDHESYGSNVVSFTVDTKRNLKLEGTSTDLIKGLKAVLTATDSQIVTSSFEYKQPHFTVNCLLNLLSPKGTTGVFATVAGYQGHAIGIQTDYNLSTNTINDINGNLTINYDRDVSFGLYGRFKKNIIGARLYHRYEQNLSIAAEAEANYVNSAEAPKFTLGADYTVDPRTSLKAKIDTIGNVSVSVISKLTDRVRVTFGTALNTNNFSSTSKASFGLNITIE